MARPKHKNKDLDQVLEAAWEKGWDITRNNRYWKLWCPCPRKHFKTVKLTPSNPNYKRELLSKLSSSTCWNEEQS